MVGHSAGLGTQVLHWCQDTKLSVRKGCLLLNLPGLVTLGHCSRLPLAAHGLGVTSLSGRAGSPEPRGQALWPQGQEHRLQPDVIHPLQRGHTAATWLSCVWIRQLEEGLLGLSRKLKLQRLAPKCFLGEAPPELPLRFGAGEGAGGLPCSCMPWRDEMGCALSLADQGSWGMPPHSLPWCLQLAALLC